MVWYTYIIRCNDDTLYTGVTTDIDRRLREHNGDLKGGAKYTRSRRPVKLLKYWETKTRSDAQKRECLIKSLSRTQKLKLLQEQI